MRKLHADVNFGGLGLDLGMPDDFMRCLLNENIHELCNELLQRFVVCEKMPYIFLIKKPSSSHSQTFFSSLAKKIHRFFYD